MITEARIDTDIIITKITVFHFFINLIPSCPLNAFYYFAVKNEFYHGAAGKIGV